MAIYSFESTVAPQITIEMRDANSMFISGNITAGRDVFLHCSVYARPNAYKMEWKHDVSLQPPSISLKLLRLAQITI